MTDNNTDMRTPGPFKVTSCTIPSVAEGLLVMGTEAGAGTTTTDIAYFPPSIEAPFDAKLLLKACQVYERTGMDAEQLDQALAAAEQKGGETLAQMLEVESEYQNLRQKHAALVEAVKVCFDASSRMNHTVVVSREAWADLMVCALAQQDQPAGEWITINEDGSNLPEHVPYAEWGLWREHSFDEVWRDWCPEDWDYISRHDASSRGRVIAYWSIPHIDRRPDIPEYAVPTKGQR